MRKPRRTFVDERAKRREDSCSEAAERYLSLGWKRDSHQLLSQRDWSRNNRTLARRSMEEAWAFELQSWDQHLARRRSCHELASPPRHRTLRRIGLLEQKLLFHHAGEEPTALHLKLPQDQLHLQTPWRQVNLCREHCNPVFQQTAPENLFNLLRSNLHCRPAHLVPPRQRTLW